MDAYSAIPIFKFRLLCKTCERRSIFTTLMGPVEPHDLNVLVLWGRPSGHGHLVIRLVSVASTLRLGMDICQVTAQVVVHAFCQCDSLRLGSLHMGAASTTHSGKQTQPYQLSVEVNVQVHIDMNELKFRLQIFRARWRSCLGRF